MLKPSCGFPHHVTGGILLVGSEAVAGLIREMKCTDFDHFRFFWISLFSILGGTSGFSRSALLPLSVFLTTEMDVILECQTVSIKMQDFSLKKKKGVLGRDWGTYLDSFYIYFFCLNYSRLQTYW